MSNLLTNLNSIQQKAVTFGKGPLLVLAGAGSGKTRVLTHRVAHLIEQGTWPDKILAVTFTNKAANEMKERVFQLIGHTQASASPWIGTFHATCAKILRRHIQRLDYPNNFLIYDTTDQKALIKQAMKNLGLSSKQFKPTAILSAISSAKNELIDQTEYTQYVRGFFQEQVAKLYPEYQKLLRQNQALDFDDLQVLTVKLFEKHPSSLKVYQDQFEYVLVDEFQDTNHIQYLLVKLLAAPQNNLCTVGDASQSIYSFRGANLKNVIQLKADFPKLTTFNLEQNYRSTQTILDAATAIIKPNEKAHPILSLWTKNSAGEPIILYEARDEKDEARFVVDEILDKSYGGIFEDFAILYRTNAQSRVLEEALIQAGLPYRLIGGVRFYERREIKDVLAYLRFIHNLKDQLSFNRIVNVPPRGIGPKTLRDERNGVTSPKLKHFYQMIKKLRRQGKSLGALELINEVLKEISYQEYICDGTLEGETRWENVQELKSMAASFAKLSPSEALTSFLESVSLLEQTDIQNRDEESVTLMTLHAAKGLEFPIVFLVGLEEGLFPHYNSLTDQSKLEEERRLCYVGITRAQKKLFLSFAKTRFLVGTRAANSPSRFLLDIPPKLIDRTLSPFSTPSAVYEEGEDFL